MQANDLFFIFAETPFYIDINFSLLLRQYKKKVNTLFWQYRITDNRFKGRQMAPHLSVWSYLTRSITLSLGAELTGSSLIMMISSPGISLPSDGPPADTHQIRIKWYKVCTVIQLSSILAVLINESSK